MLKQKLKNQVRRFIIRGARWVFPEIVAHWASYLLYLSRLSRWLRHHPCTTAPANRQMLYDFLVQGEGLNAPIDYLEFGVYQGSSLKWWCENVTNPEARFFGFDSFEGLPEDWGYKPAGTFNTGGSTPDIEDQRVELVAGLFQDTLRPFLQRYSRECRKVVHMDADLYSSTLFVLVTIAPFLKKGDIIMFDEFGSVGMPQHEFRAFEDFCMAFPISVTALAATAPLNTLAVKIV